MIEQIVNIFNIRGYVKISTPLYDIHILPGSLDRV